MDTCVFCGAPGCYLFTTALCPPCAASCELVLEARPPSGVALALQHESGRSRDLVWSEQGRPDDASWVATLEERAGRLRDIARDAALLDDPAFVADLDNYVAQIGWDSLAISTAERERATKRLFADAASLIGSD